MQPWHTLFPVWNQSVVPCPVLTVASSPAYRFLRRQVRWSGIPISLRNFQFVVIHTVKHFGIVNKIEVDVFLELSCFSYDQMDVGNLLSGSSAFSKSSLNIWKFTGSRTVEAPLPWGFPGKNTGMGCHFLLQGIFLTQGLNSGLLHFRQMLYHLSHQGSPYCWSLAWRIFWALFC